MKNNNKSRIGQKYQKKFTQAQRELIKEEYEEGNITVKQLAEKYNVKRSTMTSLLKSKGKMYNNFVNAILQRAKIWADLEFNTLNKVNGIKKQQKQITNYFKKEHFFEITKINPLQDLIPKTKQASNKLRLIKRVRNEVYEYFQSKKVSNNSDIHLTYVNFKNNDDDIYQEDNRQDFYQESPQQNIQTQQQNSTLPIDENDEYFKDNTSLSFAQYEDSIQYYFKYVNY